MSVRPFDWRDLLYLYRVRNDCLFLDSTRLLTHGPRLIPAAAMISYLGSATGVFTYRSLEKKQSLIGQVVHNGNTQLARLSFIAPYSALESANLPQLLDYMTHEVGRRGATRLLAEVNEQDVAFEMLRRAGFATYARQRLWVLSGEPEGRPFTTPWRKGSPHDLHALRALYCNLVPGLVQQVEQPPENRLHGPVYKNHDGGELMAYVETKTGPYGIWTQPFIHPDMDKVTGRLADLFKNGFNRRSRSIYLCVRSYQSWLEPAIEDLGAEPGPRLALMVKHLAVRQPEARVYVLPALEHGHPKVTATIVGRTIKT